MPRRDEPAREPLLKRMLFGDSVRNEREEKVLEYIIHRINGDVPLDDVIREDYVRRNCSQNQIDDIVKDPELVHACRKRLWQTFKSDELNPRRRPG